MGMNKNLKKKLIKEGKKAKKIYNRERRTQEKKSGEEQ